jgi:hypothetical protein
MEAITAAHDGDVQMIDRSPCLNSLPSASGIISP